jgi:hypothetical protein
MSAVRHKLSGTIYCCVHCCSILCCNLIKRVWVSQADGRLPAPGHVHGSRHPAAAVPGSPVMLPVVQDGAFRSVTAARAAGKAEVSLGSGASPRHKPKVRHATCCFMIP